MFCGNSVLIGMIILLVLGYLVVYGSSSTTIREGLSPPPCPKNWWATESQTKGLCVQTCPSDSQTRDADGRCKCGLGAPNQSCVAGTVCVNNVCIANAQPDKTGKGPATSLSMKCPSQFPHLLPFPAGATDDYHCYQNPDGNNGKGGLCNCNCSNCGYNDSFENCTSLGASCAEACPTDHPYYATDVYGVKYGLCCTKGWSGGKCNGATSLNAGVLSGDILIPPCSSQTITKRSGPDGNGTLIILTPQNPEGIKIYATDVAILGKSPKVYFYPSQPAGMNLYENKIQSRSTDSNGTLYLVCFASQGLGTGVRIVANDAACFANTSSLFIGPGPENPNITPSPIYPGGVNLDGRYHEGDPRRYAPTSDAGKPNAGGWALRNGLGVASQCDALCAQQPECHLPGNTCTSTTYTNPGRCYCTYQKPPPAANPKKIIHWVGDCNQCSRSWCTGGPKNNGKVMPQEVANALYSVGSPLSTWGCQNVTADSEQVSIRAQPNAQSQPVGSLARGGIFVIESPHPKCSSITCPTGFAMSNASKLCSGQVCQNEECCTQNPVCTAEICSGSMLKLKGSMIGSTIVDEASCVAAGGTSYAYCTDNDIHYCAGPCTGIQSCPSNSGLHYNACPKPAQITCDVPVVISNPVASQPYLDMGGPNQEALTHSSTKKANFIFRSVNHDQSQPKQPLNYTDKVIIQWAALNNGGRAIDQPDGKTSNCGWYGCRVMQPPDTNSGRNPIFDHGGDDPAVFMLMAPPEYVKTDSNFNGPIYNGAPFCLQYAGTLTQGADVNWGYTPNCGWFGCRILSDYLGQRPDLGEFGWDHGNGQDVAGGGTTGYPHGPTVFTIEAPTEEGVPCKGATCTTAECCDSLATCDNYTCDAKHTKKGGHITCASATCTVDECCVPNPTCGSFPCSSGYHLKTNPSGITCTQTPCAQNECCDINPTCATYTCPVDEHLKSNPSSIHCKGAQCTDTECCGLNPVCSTFQCPETNFYHDYHPIPNAPNVYCKAETCTQSECCTATPTDAMPLVQTWPLYPQNYEGKSSQF